MKKLEIGKIELPQSARWVMPQATIGDALINEIHKLRADLARKDSQLLDAYSRWLEKKGYMDSDWYTEGNTVQEFLDERMK
jgi:hypothetical protein